MSDFNTLWTHCLRCKKKWEPVVTKDPYLHVLDGLLAEYLNSKTDLGRAEIREKFIGYVRWMREEETWK